MIHGPMAVGIPAWATRADLEPDQGRAGTLRLLRDGGAQSESDAHEEAQAFTATQ